MGYEKLMKSRRFTTMAIEVVLMVIIAVLPADIAPGIAENKTEIISALVVLAGVLIGGYSVEDAVATYKGTKQ